MRKLFGAIGICLVMALLAACETTGQGTATPQPTLPTIPTIPVPSISEQNCLAINQYIWQIEMTKHVTGRYGEQEEERLEKWRSRALLLGCIILEFDPNNPPIPAPVPAPKPAPAAAA